MSTDSLPTSVEVEEVVLIGKSKMHRTPVYLFTPFNLKRLRAAQHAASRRATLEEVQKEMGNHPTCDNPFLCVARWLATQLDGGDE